MILFNNFNKINNPVPQFPGISMTSEILDILKDPEALDEIVTYVFKKIDTDNSGEIEVEEIEDLMLAFATKGGG